MQMNNGHDDLMPAERALAFMQAEERKARRKGWKWMEIGKKTKILVPCDKKGEPTHAGKRKIAEWQKVV